MADITEDEVAPDQVSSEPIYRPLTNLMDKLHLAIWRVLPRGNWGNTWNPIAAARPYHVAYMASRVHQLESMVGVMASILMELGILNQEVFIQRLTDIYGKEIDELRLNAALVQSGRIMAGGKPSNLPPDPNTPGAATDETVSSPKDE